MYLKIMEDIGYIKARLEDVHLDIKEIKKHRFHSEKRIESLEKSRSYAKGGVGLMAILLTSTVAFLSKWIHY